MLSARLLWQRGSIMTRSCMLATSRGKHRNHPGFKRAPLAYERKYELPDEFVSEPIYPPVKPKFPSADYEQAWPDNESLAWSFYGDGEKFHSLKTIQERLSVLAYLNVQQTVDELKYQRTRFYPIYKLDSCPRTLKSLPFVQYITKTRLDVVESTTPSIDIDANLYEMIKSNVKQSILNHLVRQQHLDEVHEVPNHPDKYIPEEEQFEQSIAHKQEASNKLIRDIFDSISSLLVASTSSKNAKDYEHLLRAQYGQNVDIKAYWKKSGFGKQRPRGAVYPDVDNLRFQFEDKAAYQIKCDMPLAPRYEVKSSENESMQPIENYAYNPVNFRIFADHTLPMQVPGHWYGDSREFNYLTVYNTNKIMSSMANKYPDSTEIFSSEVLKNMAVSCGHAELTAQAYYLGFSMWKQLTYPLFGRFIFTNGQDFSFSDYQLNNIQLWNDSLKTNENSCHMTPPKRLYELNDDLSDFKSFDDNVFKQILGAMSARPIENAHELVKDYSPLDYKIGGTRLRPYLTIQNFRDQLSERHQLLAISLYELVKYDKPLTFLNFRNRTAPVTERPKIAVLYNKFTYEFRDIVMDYYPRDYFGLSLIERLNRKAPKQKEIFWDIKQPVYEWMNVPPPKTNNIPREINLAKF